jgi:hypothetical protein
MKEKIKLAIWEKAKSTYPMGSSKHTNALLEDDFDFVIAQINNFTKVECLKLLEELSDYIPCEVYTKKVIEIKERCLS